MFLKSTYFLCHNVILFSEKNYKNETQIFYQNHSLVLHTAEIFCNLILRNHWSWTWKILECLTELRLTLLYIGLGPKKYANYLTGLNSFYDILELDLKNTQAGAGNNWWSTVIDHQDLIHDRPKSFYYDQNDGWVFPCFKNNVFV